MNYYQHHIGDFNNATRYLTLVERALYRDLIEMYYDTEKPIDGSDFDRLARRLLCRTDEEKTALKFVLSEFFTLVDDHYVQSRCEREINEYHDKKDQQSRAGKASAQKRTNKKATSNQGSINEKSNNDAQSNNECLTDAEQTLNDRSTNHKPLTNNHKPLTNSVSAHAQEQNSLDEILNLWNPELLDVNIWLKKAGCQELTQDGFDQLKPTFLGHYSDQIKTGRLNHHKLFVKLVSWIKGDYTSYRKQTSEKQNIQNDGRNVNDAWPEIQHAPATAEGLDLEGMI